MSKVRSRRSHSGGGVHESTWCCPRSGGHVEARRLPPEIVDDALSALPAAARRALVASIRHHRRFHHPADVDPGKREALALLDNLDTRSLLARAFIARRDLGRMSAEDAAATVLDLDSKVSHTLVAWVQEREIRVWRDPGQPNVVTVEVR